MKNREFDNLLYDYYKKEKYKINITISGIVITLIIMSAATLLSFLFRYIGFHESNIIVSYILGVLIVANRTDGYIYGILASVIGVLTFNFFFTQPYFTLLAYRPDYPVTFIIMLIAAIITSTLTAKAKHEVKLLATREKMTHILYEISNGLMNIRSIEQISEIGGREIATLFNRYVIISIINSSDDLGEINIYPDYNNKISTILKSANQWSAIKNTFVTGQPSGIGTDIYPNNVAYCIPIKGQSDILGVLGVLCLDKKPLSDAKKMLLDAVTTQIALGIEREMLSVKQRKSEINVESEKLRSNLLSAISHDLRTPLTGILGSTSTILANENILDLETKRELLKGIYDDTSWLIHAVENILSLTRIEESRFKINRNMEAVEEIIVEAVSRVKKLSKDHIINIDIPNALVMLPIDGTLIEQVVINLIENAIKYTPNGSTINIKSYIEGNNVIFEVSDNGNGIPDHSIDFIFDRFYTVQNHNGIEKHGTGLGLAICKSIIKMHSGQINAFNNSSGGATFRFSLPMKE